MGENDRRKYFTINLYERMLPTSAGVEPATSWSPVGRRIQLRHWGQPAWCCRSNSENMQRKFCRAVFCNSSTKLRSAWFCRSNSENMQRKCCRIVLCNSLHNWDLHGSVEVILKICRESAAKLYSETYLKFLNNLMFYQHYHNDFMTLNLMSKWPCILKYDLQLTYSS